MAAKSLKASAVGGFGGDAQHNPNPTQPFQTAPTHLNSSLFITRTPTIRLQRPNL